MEGAHLEQIQGAASWEAAFKLRYGQITQLPHWVEQVWLLFEESPETAPTMTLDGISQLEETDHPSLIRAI